MNPKLDVSFWVSMNQNNRIKFHFHFISLKFLPSFFFCPKGIATSQGSEIMKTTHLSDIIIQVSK